MTNPYGMTEVDIPGVLGAYEAGQTNRVRRMLYRQQADAAERQAERDNTIRTTLARAFGGGGDGKPSGAAGAYATPSVGDTVGTSMYAGSGGMVGAPPPAPAAAPPQAPRQSNFRQFIPDLLAAGMEPSQVAALAQLDGAQSSAAVERWQRVAPLLMEARGRPLADRRAFIEMVLPQVQELGLPQEQIAAVLNDPSDARLDAHLRLGTTMTQALEQSQPQLMAAPQGGAIVGVNRRTQEPTVLYESPTIAGPNGEIYARPPAASARPSATPPQVGEIRRGYRYNGGNPADPQSWTPAGGTQTGAAPDWPIPGGAASGQRPFP